MIGYVLAFIIGFLLLGAIWGALKVNSPVHYSSFVSTEVQNENLIIRKKNTKKPMLFPESIHDVIESILLDPKNIACPLISYRKQIASGEIPTKQRVLTSFTGQQYHNALANIVVKIDKFLKNNQTRVCLFLEPGIAWHATNFAVQLKGCVIVTVHSTLSKPAILNAFVEARPTVIVTSKDSLQNLTRLLDSETLDFVEAVLVHFYNVEENIERVFEQLSAEAKKNFPEAVFIQHSICPEDNEIHLQKFSRQITDTAAIIYTSGTSSEKAKGVVVTEHNLHSSITFFYSDAHHFLAGIGGNYLSFLPAAHVFEYMMSFQIIMLNYSYVFGSAKTLSGENCLDEEGQPAGDLAIVRPTVMACVPLVLARLRHKIEGGIAKKGAFALSLYRFLYAFKHFPYKFPFLNDVADLILFRKVRQTLGGKLHFLLSGGAALQDELKEFCETVLGVRVVEGYGLTETVAAGLISLPCDSFQRRAFVGVPKSGIEVCLRIDRNRLARDPSGHLVVEGALFMRGKNIALQYLNGDPVIDSDGWLDTGDRAITTCSTSLCQELTDKGFLNDKSLSQCDYASDEGAIKITGREKEIVKLSNGEFINLVEIEFEVKKIVGVENCALFVFVDKVVLLVLSTDLVSYNKEYFEKQLTVLTDKRLKKIKKVIVVHGDWSIENGVLTPTLKLRRFKLRELYKDILE